jgi:uroporphyrin-III C-methyltransferase
MGIPNPPLSWRRRRTRAKPRGLVSLVVAGPGDPGLLTLKALDRLLKADVVYHDALVSEEVLALVPRETRRVAVGKRRGRLSIPQREIETRLAEEARRGRRVVRLKGGDPFVFGRGGEEALALLRRGIPFEIVPGISSGLGVPAMAGIPVTHRGTSSSVAFVTAHDLGPGETGRLVRAQLRDLARSADTLVVFMAGAMVSRVRRVLLDAGLPAGTPAAAIVNGTRAGERRSLTTLDALDRLAFSPSQGPVLLVFGATVALAETLRSAMHASRWEVEGVDRLRPAELFLESDPAEQEPAAKESDHEPSAA